MSNEDESMASGSGEEQEPVVESLIAGRQRRSTAANRYSTLLQQEGGGEDDDLELLFAEDGVEEDVEFAGEDGEAASDVDMDSSDDDDQGPTAAGPEDQEGEKELEKQERADRKKKRKAEMTFTKLKPRAPRGVKVDPTAGPIASNERPKKKSERVSWLPTTDEGPVRSSSRRQTVQNKEVVYKRMKESEVKRRKQIKVMEAAAKRKEAEKVPALSQADRMAEAARIERQNAKSLNRWEADEKKRQEERQAKLDALKNRKLEGPVITYWSGPCTWLGDKLVSVGTGSKVVEIKEPARAKPGPKPKGGGEYHGAAIDAEKAEHGLEDVPMLDAHASLHPPMVLLPTAVENAMSTKPSATASAEQQEMNGEAKLHLSPVGDKQPPSQYPSHEGISEGQTVISSMQVDTPTLPKAQTPIEQSQTSLPPESNPYAEEAGPLVAQYHQYQPSVPSQYQDQTLPPPFFAPQAAFPPHPPPPTRELATRSLIILENLDTPSAYTTPELRNHILLKARKAPKVTAKQAKSSQELCAITGQPARFRDPKTGLAYKGPEQFDEIRKLETQGCRWSTLLGLWVGDRERAARGVPEGFTAPRRLEIAEILINREESEL